MEDTRYCNYTNDTVYCNSVCSDCGNKQSYEQIGDRFVYSLFKQAQELGENKQALKKRLHEAAQVFDGFKVTGSKFDFKNKCLINKENTLRLQWNNTGNTSVGQCCIEKI